jgi:hypothetical protein
MQAVPKWYWLAAVVALLWTIAGCWGYVVQVTTSPAEIAAMTPAQQADWPTMPMWVTASYAVAVWSALAGAVLLLLRRMLARPLFLLSLVGIVLTFGWSLLETDMLTRKGPISAAFPCFIFLAGVAMWWLASYATRRGWLR